MKIGYARVSTTEQNVQAQHEVLSASGCDKIVTEIVSGASIARPQLAKTLASMSDGDTLVIVRLDRLGRSLSNLIEIVRLLETKGVGLLSLSEAINTSSPGGRFLFHLMGSLAEFERALLIERTHAGIESARKRGVHLGRPRALTAKQINHANALISVGEAPSSIAKSLGVDRSTLYRALRATRHTTSSASGISSSPHERVPFDHA
jgi:DNA invertase Pin-like site-specific DNA recombinase